MRGQHSLYSGVFPAAVTIEPERKAKRNVHLEKRDEVLVCRYYFHAQIRRRRYDDCLMYLEQEFFITPTVIIQRLNEKQLLLKELVSKKATVAYFRKLYPFFAW